MLAKLHYTGMAAMVFGAMLAVAPTNVSALAGDSLKSEIKALVVTKDANGVEVATPAEEAAPGDVVEYQITYTNVGEEALSGLIVNGPMPQSTIYVGGSARVGSGDKLEVSIDGGDTWETEPVKRMQKDASGKIVEVVIPATEYTNVRWISNDPIKPSASTMYSYRVTIE